jgi:exopolysaccharide biosynthesis polyprenyl glycosylphosphotransferase
MSTLFLQIRKLLLLVGDIAVLYGALFLTLIIRYGYGQGVEVWDQHLIPFTIIFGIWLIVFFIYEWYDLRLSYNTSNLFFSLLRLMSINIVLAVIIFYFLTPLFDNLKPQRVLLIDGVTTLALLFLWRKLFYATLRSPRITNNVLILGDDPLAHQIAKEIAHRPQLGYAAIHLTQLPPSLTAYCREHYINVLVADTSSTKHPEYAEAIFNCVELGINIQSLTIFYETIVNKIPVEAIEHDWFLENLSEHSKKPYEVGKRISDIILASIGITLTAPFIPFIALIIKLDSTGPIIFSQIRTGKNGRKFMAMKFRSMIHNAEKDGPQWAQKNDSRITRFGNIMRKTRLDEIPQLINVLRGELSIVGPRPERPEFIRMLTQQIPFYQQRLLVKPGLTGWAQLLGPAYGGSVEESLEKVKYDLYYIKHRSLMLDINIILKTVKIIISGRGQ